VLISDGVRRLGIELRTFATLKDISEFVANQTSQYKALFEDYSQWLGTVLRDAESKHKTEEWFQKSAALQKNLKAQAKKPPEPDKSKKGGKGKGNEDSPWIQTGDISISFTEQGQSELMFEAIEKITAKIQEYEKFKSTIQQLTRLGLGQTVNYIVYLDEDVPKKIVLKQKATAKGEDAFKFDTELMVPAYYNLTENPMP
jgi:hypothetical protein